MKRKFQIVPIKRPVSTISISAGTKLDFSDLTIDASEDASHPNRLPFTGTLLILNKPSDQPPHGAEGHPIYVPKQVAQQRLRGLIGMGVNVAADLEGHNPQHKVGVITSAWIDGDKVKVKGSIWKKDFPDAEQDIKGNRTLGMSMELGDVLVRDRDEDTWHLEDFAFTGATILKRDSAAYWNTSLAASAEAIGSAALDAASVALGISQGGKEMADKVKDDAKNQGQILAAAISAAVGPAIEKALTTGMQSVADSLKASNETNSKLLASLDKLEGTMVESQGNILAAIESLAGVEAEADVSAADATNDATGGDATTDATVDAAAGDATSDATADATGDATSDATYTAEADITTGPGMPGNLNDKASSHSKSQSKGGASGQLKAAAARRTAQRIGSVAAAAVKINEMHAQIQQLEKDKAKLVRKVDSLQAQTETWSRRIERKSMSPELATLLTKGGYNPMDVLAGAASGKRAITVPELDAAIERSLLNLNPTDKIRFKNELVQLGALDEGVVSRPWMNQ